MEITAAFKRVMWSGIYDTLARNNGATERADATTSETEYFTESPEAFFGTNDLDPFTRRQLKKHDPEMFALLARRWQVSDVRASTEPSFAGIRRVVCRNTPQHRLIGMWKPGRTFSGRLRFRAWATRRRLCGAIGSM